MRAAVYHQYGPPDVLRIEQRPDPVAGAGEVLVRVLASSVNDWDHHLLTGRPVINRIGGWREPAYPVLGADVAGRVEAVGAGVTRFAPGDEVVGDLSSCGFGAFADHAVAPEDALFPKPAGLTFEQAAAVPQAAGLAMAALRFRRPPGAGDRVLVNGAGGGVGTFAVQIAAHFGAEVTGVDAAHKLETVGRAGAVHLIDYRREDFADRGERYDLIVDVASYRSIREYRRALRPGGACALIGGSIPRVLFAFAVGPVTSLLGGPKVGVPVWRANNPSDADFVRRLLEAQVVTPVVDSTYPLERLRDAFLRFGESLHAGKIVITMRP